MGREFEPARRLQERAKKKVRLRKGKELFLLENLIKFYKTFSFSLEPPHLN